MIISCLQFVVVVLCRYLYEDDVDSQMIFNMLNAMGIQAFNCWIIHMAITKFGMYLIEAEILRNGNEKLLNNLEEGVVI